MIRIQRLWSFPNQPQTTGLKNKLKATFEIKQCWIFAVLWRQFWKWRSVEIFQCRESIQDVEFEQCWICVVLWWPFWKWRPVEIFQCRESIRDIIINPYMKCRWNRTMLNLCGIVATILKMAAARNFPMSGHQYLPTYQILMISNNVEFYRTFFMPCFGSHFENGRHLENFENAELLL